jgi:RNA polymerase sigma factor (sigma-70 family)
MEAHIGLSTDVPRSGMHAHGALTRDERLARLIGKGSERAFVALYHRYHRQLYRYCRSMLRDDADAQDALQSTFAGVFAALRDGRRDAPLRPWLFRIAHNESISILRRRRPHSELPDALPNPVAAIDEQAENHERLRHLVADLRDLPERQRAALLMRELSGLSHEEIAVALSSTVGTAKQTIYEARRALAEFEEGRMASCDDICRTISNGDRRALRGRRIRAHLRECAACSAFAAAIPARSADLRALTPALPPAATALLLSRALAGSVARGGGTGSGAAGAGAAGKATTLALSGAKLATSVVIAATATFGVATVLRPHHGTLRPHGHASAARAVIRTGPAANTHERGSGGHAATVRAGASTNTAGAPARPAAATRTGSTTSSAPPARRGRHHPISSTAAPTGAPTRASSAPAPASSAPAGTPAASFSHGRGSTNGQGAGRGISAGGYPPAPAAHGQAQRSSAGGAGSGHAAPAHHANPVAQLRVPPTPLPLASGLAKPGAAVQRPSVVSRANSAAK